MQFIFGIAQELGVVAVNGNIVQVIEIGEDRDLARGLQRESRSQSRRLEDAGRGRGRGAVSGTAVAAGSFRPAEADSGAQAARAKT